MVQAWNNFWAFFASIFSAAAKIGDAADKGAGLLGKQVDILAEDFDAELEQARAENAAKRKAREIKFREMA